LIGDLVDDVEVDSPEQADAEGRRERVPCADAVLKVYSARQAFATNDDR
jgi:hypothetical protein